MIEETSPLTNPLGVPLARSSHLRADCSRGHAIVIGQRRRYRCGPSPASGQSRGQRQDLASQT